MPKFSTTFSEGLPNWKRATQVILCTLSLSALPHIAGAQDAIKLGFIGPLTGGNAQQGLGARNGFLLAIKQANAAGYPFRIEGITLDDASDPAVGVSAALKLVNDNQVAAVTAHWNSPVALATTPVFNRYQMPTVIWGAISPKITEANLPVVTRVTPTLEQENRPLAEWLVKSYNRKKMAIISDTSDYGVSNTNAMSQYFTAAGGTVISKAAAPVGTTDFQSMLTKIKSENPDIIYFGGVITEAALVRKQMMALGMAQIPMSAISGIYDPKYLEIAGSAANDTVVSSPRVPESAALQNFQKAYEAAGFSEPAGPYAKYAYDAANIMLKAIKENGYKDKAALAKVIRSIKYNGVLGQTEFDQKGQTRLPVIIDIKEARDGKWVDWAQK
ncbi:branched-chain amino acid ABC transporter substrate-binding protein [Noviherbaspirillum saxi]|uniref:Branched-chain amino acid ABC transporter substrate-binding protein n=1 Tax=Noviherbaspirillum saxi TaxID=2320863 RepID=A0A3A3FH28_9BURK|nr:branched-chain amino acid ABC transporter substrate-binding protein [Noviherbaspirillum saxi]RJF91804.1 branched-chain amino acid ABC transporter substrate-binding protein [Noviherbaspirillum saxi]